MSLAGRTLLITGASRGIGLAIGLRAARDGANVAILAKTAEPHPKLPGTIFTAAEDIERAGGKALPIQCDIRDEDALAAAVEQAARHFGGIDILVNNASAISLTSTPQTETKRFDLMLGINTRGTWLATKLCLPHLKRGTNPHVLMLSPPLDMKPKWFGPHVAYSIAKYGMSLCVLGFAEEFRRDGIAVNALWPRTTIATAAVQFAISEQLMKMSRKPDILAEAAWRIFQRDARDFTGNFLIDDSFLVADGLPPEALDAYRVDPTQDLASDFFVPEDSTPPASLKRIS